VWDAKPDARILGLGGSSASLPAHAGSFSENPALTSTGSGFCFSASYIRLFMDQSLYSVVLGNKSSFRNTGFSLQWIQYSGDKNTQTKWLTDSAGIPLFDEQGNQRYEILGNFSDIFNGVSATGAMEVVENVYAGFMVKTLFRSILGSTSYGAGADAGIYSEFRQNRIRLGLSIKDVIPLKLNTEGGETERLLVFGAAYKFNQGFCVTGQTENGLHSSFDRALSAGLEWNPLSPLAFRLGVNSDYYAFGAGVSLAGFHIDYSVVNDSNFGMDNPHRLTVSYMLGGKT
jgi:hypothetical protein